MQRELSAKLTEGLYFFEFFPFYNPSASHLLGTSLYTREAWVTLRTKMLYGVELIKVERSFLKNNTKTFPVGKFFAELFFKKAT